MSTVTTRRTPAGLPPLLPPDFPAFATVDQVAELLQMARSQVWDVIYRGELATIRTKPRTVRIPKQSLEAWLAVCLGEPR